MILNWRITKPFFTECHFAYRDSLFKQQAGRFVILSVALLLTRDKPFTLDYGEMRPLAENESLSVAMVRDKVIQVRQAKLPDPGPDPECWQFLQESIGVDSTGSEACRSVSGHCAIPARKRFGQAGRRLADRSGWLERVSRRTCRCARAAGSGTDQPWSSATARILLELAEAIRNSVQARYGVRLEIEPNVIS